MGRYVCIKKYKTENNVHYYKVSSIDYPEVQPFSIGIDVSNQTITFYQAEDIFNPCFIYHLKTSIEKLPNNDWLPASLMLLCIAKGLKALETMRFSEYISFQS